MITVSGKSQDKIIHTPGPWSIDGEATSVVVGPDGVDVAITFTGGARQDETDAANANLIAAAPDLLVACMKGRDVIMNFLENGGKISRAEFGDWHEMFAAIEKAKGGAK